MVDVAQSLSTARAPRVGRLRVLGTIGHAFRIFAAAPVSFIALSLLLAAPGYLRLAREGFDSAQKFTPSTIVGLVVYILLLYLVQTAMTHVALQTADGGRSSLVDALKTGVRRYLPMLGVSLIAMIAIYAGLFLLIVPGVIAACIFAVVVPVCTAEPRGPIECLRRSAALTKGQRWRILGIYVLVFVPVIAFSLANMFLNFNAGHTGTYVILSQALALFLTPLSTILGAMIYVELRRLKESVGVASVFE